MASWNRRRPVEVELGALGRPVRALVRPLAQTSYELYSVPAFRRFRPETLRGAEIASPKHPVVAGDLLLCKLDLKTSRAWTVQRSATGLGQLAATEYLVLRTNDLSLTCYLVWYLRSPRFRGWLCNHRELVGRGSSQGDQRDARLLRAPVLVVPPHRRWQVVFECERLFQGTGPCGDLRRCTTRWHDSLNTIDVFKA